MACVTPSGGKPQHSKPHTDSRECLVGSVSLLGETVAARELLSNETLAATFEALPTAAALIDDSGRICATNAALQKLFGYREDQLHMTLLEALLPEPHERPDRALDADGRAFPVEVTSNPVALPTGHGTVVVIVDRSSTEEIGSLFEGTFEASQQCLALIDDQHVIVRVNRRLAHALGYEPAAARGRQLARIVPGLFDVDRATGRVQLRVEPTPSLVDGPRVLTALHAGGREVAVDVTLTVLTPSRSLVSFTVLDDQHDRVRAARSRLDMATEVEFTHVASHDLKSPLRGVSDLVEWITEELGDGTSASVAHNLGRIRARLLRMELLIDQLLAYSRVGRSPGSQRLIDMADLVGDALGLVAVPDTFAVEVDIEVPPFIGSSTPLETVVRNLLSNAVKHHDRADGKIEIRARAGSQFCRIEVSDDGPGIPSVDHARIFRLFQTANAKQADNAGLGLAVCRRLCEVHGATIEIDPSPRRGTRFVVEWPLVATSDAQEI